MSRHCWGSLLCLLAVCTGCAEMPPESTPLPPPPEPPGVTLVIESIPAELLMGQSFSVTVVAWRDDTKADDFTGEVVLSLEGGGSATILSGTTRAAAVRGEAHFSDLHIDVMAKDLHLRATVTGLDPAVSTAFDVAPWFQLSFTELPAQIRSGQPFDLTVQAMRYSATAPDFAETVTLSLDGPGTTASLSGTTTAQAEGGAAHFTGLRIDGTGYGMRFRATSARSTDGLSAEFDLPVKSPAWTPIAFSDCLEWTWDSAFDDVCAEFGLIVLHSDGTESVIARAPFGIETPAWSPDGHRIAYAGRSHCAQLRDCLSEIYVINADGSGLTRLTTGSAERRESQEPTWSPDGSHIAFSVWDVGLFDYPPSLYLMRSDGTDVTSLGGLSGAWPAWSPDGRRIAFSAPDNAGHWAVFVGNADGSAPSQLTHPTGSVTYDWAPSWSDDGTRIAFTRAVSYGSQILVTNLEGSTALQITHDPVRAYHPAWSPEGTRIAFATGAGLWLSKPDGTEAILIRRLTWPSRAAWAPATAGVP